MAELVAIDKRLELGNSDCAARGEVARQSAGISAAISWRDSFPEFEILEELGRGGMGVVYKARQRSLQGRIVALKTIPAGTPGRRSLAERLLAEARALSRIDHPHVVRVFDVLDRSELVCLVLEYIDGESLSRRAVGQALAPLEAARITGTIAATMAEVHAGGLLHRDLKPANVMRDRRGMIRITDFGLSKDLAAHSQGTTTGDFAGSPSYMAPEQAAGRGSQISQQTDIYAIGATLYDLLTGRPPFAGATILETLQQVQLSEPVSPRRLVPGIPCDLETICLKCLEKDPSQRYASARDLAADIDNFLGGRPVAARPVQPLGRAWRWSRRHPERAGLVAAILLGLMSLAAVISWSVTRLIDADRRGQADRQALSVQRFYSNLREIQERSTRRPTGWTWENLALTKEAAQRIPENDTAATSVLYSEAVKSLVAADVRKSREILKGFDSYTLTFSPDGRLLVAGANADDNGTIELQVVETATWQTTQTILFPADPDQLAIRKRPDGVRSLRFHQNGTRLYVGTRSGWIRVFDVGGRSIRAWRAHNDYVQDLLFDESGETLFSCSADQTVRSWSPDGTPQHELPTRGPAARLAWARASDTIQLVVASREETIFLSPDTLEAVPDSHAWKSDTVCSMPDGFGALLLAREKRVEIWDPKTGRMLSALSIPRGAPGSRNEIDGLAISRDGRWIVSANSNSMTFWDMAAASLVCAIPTGGRGRITPEFHPTKDLVAVTGNDRITLFELAHRKIEDQVLGSVFPVEDAVLVEPGAALATCAWCTNCPPRQSPWLRVAAGRDDGSEPVLTGLYLGDVQMSAMGLATSHDGAWLSLSLDDLTNSRIWLIDREANRIAYELGNIRDVHACMFSTDGGRLYFAARSNIVLPEGDDRRPGEIRYLHLPTRENHALWTNTESERTLRRSRILAMDVSSTQIACTSNDGQLRILQADGGQLLVRCGLENYADAIRIAPGGIFVLAGDRQGRLLLIDAQRGSIRKSVGAHRDGISDLIFAGPRLAISGSIDRSIKFWHLHDEELRELFTVEPFSGPVKRLSTSGDGRRLLVLVEGETAVRVLYLDRLQSALRTTGLELPTGILAFEGDTAIP